MQTVLSIDVDYFVDPKVTGPFRHLRPKDDEHTVRDLPSIKEFLESRCLLDSARPIPGLSANDHDIAFSALRQWITLGQLRPPIRLVHLDAHADLGLGDAGYAEILEDILHRPLSDRASNLRDFGLGNWLAYAIANRWINEVVFVREPDPGIDHELLACFFCGSAVFSVLQMRPMTQGQYLQINHYNLHQYAALPTTEPAVKWTQVSEAQFALKHPPDFIFTCLSPKYSPPKADAAFELVKSFIRSLDGGS